MEAFKKKKIQDETQFTNKIDDFLNFNPPVECLGIFFAGF
jgi:hypothetical protein